MTDLLNSCLEVIALSIDVLGIAAISGGLFVATFRFAFGLQESDARSYTGLRREIGQSILLGLEILTASTIIRTILLEPSTSQALALGVIVLIRVVLTFTVEIELNGSLPWKRSG